jgi:hypothetical protein
MGGTVYIEIRSIKFKAMAGLIRDLSALSKWKFAALPPL